MLRKALLLVLSLVMVFVIAACSSNEEATETATETESTDTTAEAPAEEAPKEPKTLNLFWFKSDMDAQMKELVGEFNKEYPHLTINVETINFGWEDVLKTRMAAGEGPDIFVVNTTTMIELYKNRMADLSNESWVPNALDVFKGDLTVDGKLLGMPYIIEAYGLVYNKKLFEQAGITELPRSISELTAVVEKLKAAGITPFASGSKEPWVLGFHSMNLPFATQDDPAKFIADLNSGAAKITDNQRFKEFQQFIDLYIGNAEKNQLTTDYNTQLTLVATGQAAMMHQGTWTENFIAQLGEDIQNLGLLPVPINDDPEFSNKVQSGSPFAWAVNTENGNEAEGKLFLDYLVNSDTGKRYMTEVFQWIPAYTNIPFNSGGGVMKDAAKISAENRIHPWVFYGWPVGWSDKSGETMQAYIAGKLTWDEVLSKLQADWDALVKK